MSQTVQSTPPVLAQSPNAVAHASNLWDLTRNELFKLWKRRLVWGLLAFDLLAVFAAWLVLVYYALKTSDGFTAGHLLGGSTGLADAIGQPMTLGRRVGEFIAVALGGLVFGGEFSSGAIRLVLSRGVNRGAYLLAKYIALAVACLALVLAGLLMSMLLTLPLRLLNADAPTLLQLNGSIIVTLFGVCLGTFENFLFCLLLGAALSIITRSAAFGIAAGFGYLIGEDIAAQILPLLGQSVHTPLGQQLVNILFTPNLNAFYSNSLPPFLARGLDQLDGVIACTPGATSCLPVGIAHALIVALIWGLVLALVSTFLFIKRDVLQ